MSLSRAHDRVRETINAAADAVELDADVAIPTELRESVVRPVLENASFLADVETDNPEAKAQLFKAARSIFEQGASASRKRPLGPPVRQGQQQQQEQQSQQQQSSTISVSAQDLLQFTWPWPIGTA